MYGAVPVVVFLSNVPWFACNAWNTIIHVHSWYALFVAMHFLQLGIGVTAARLSACDSDVMIGVIDNDLRVRAIPFKHSCLDPELFQLKLQVSFIT